MMDLKKIVAPELRAVEIVDSVALYAEEMNTPVMPGRSLKISCTKYGTIASILGIFPFYKLQINLSLDMRYT